VTVQNARSGDVGGTPFKEYYGILDMAKELLAFAATGSAASAATPATTIGLLFHYGVAVAHYNWCRVHETLDTTPAVALGITDHAWSIGELLDAALSVAPPAPTETAPDRRRQFKVIQGGKN
jgi:hypothetical protein